MSIVLEPHRKAARTRVLRGGDDAPWELWQRVPAAGLSGLVAALWAGLVSQPCRHRVLPNGEATLMFHLGAAQRLIECDGSARQELLRVGFVSGLHERPATFESFAKVTRVVCARLSPLGAHLLLGGMPQGELAHRVLEIDALFARAAGAAELHERMLGASDLGAALDLLETWLLARLQHARTPHAAARAASALLHGARGALPVSEIARESGLSPRRMRELFVREIGVSPKRLSRIVRFRHALERLSRRPVMGGVDLSRLALECGYYDQPHLNREFRELALMTPVEYLRLRGDGLDGPDVVAG